MTFRSLGLRFGRGVFNPPVPRVANHSGARGYHAAGSGVRYRGREEPCPVATSEHRGASRRARQAWSRAKERAAAGCGGGQGRTASHPRHRQNQRRYAMAERIGRAPTGQDQRRHAVTIKASSEPAGQKRSAATPGQTRKPDAVTERVIQAARGTGKTKDATQWQRRPGRAPAVQNKNTGFRLSLSEAETGEALNHGVRAVVDARHGAHGLQVLLAADGAGEPQVRGR